MNIFKILFVLYFLSLESLSSRKIGTFWHISNVCCTDENDDSLEPMITSTCINETIKTLLLRSVRFSPDFILWSNAGGPYLEPVIAEMKIILDNIVVLPSLPPIHLPAAEKDVQYYQNISNYFGNWLNEDSHHTFWKAGYYSQKLTIPENVKVIVLNTALFCNLHVASELDDPGHQWSWLSLELIKARKAQTRVYLLLSATPGITSTYDTRMFSPKHNEHYIAMIRRFSDVIKGQFGGFQEGNQFHIFYDKDEKACSWMMLSPPFPYAARLYMYDTETFQPLDYIQFSKMDQDWHLQYRFTSYYVVPNISLFSLELLITRMQRNEDIYNKYIFATELLEPNSTESCANKNCSKLNMCNCIAVDYNAYIECMVQDDTLYLSRQVSHASYSIMSGLLLVECCLSVLLIKYQSQ